MKDKDKNYVHTVCEMCYRYLPFKEERLFLSSTWICQTCGNKPSRRVDPYSLVCAMNGALHIDREFRPPTGPHLLSSGLLKLSDTALGLSGHVMDFVPDASMRPRILN